MRVLREDGAVSAETCRRYLENSKNIQFYIAFSWKIEEMTATVDENARNGKLHDRDTTLRERRRTVLRSTEGSRYHAVR